MRWEANEDELCTDRHSELILLVLSQVLNVKVIKWIGDAGHHIFLIRMFLCLFKAGADIEKPLPDEGQIKIWNGLRAFVMKS